LQPRHLQDRQALHNPGRASLGRLPQRLVRRELQARAGRPWRRLVFVLRHLTVVLHVLVTLEWRRSVAHAIGLRFALLDIRRFSALRDASSAFHCCSVTVYSLGTVIRDRGDDVCSSRSAGPSQARRTASAVHASLRSTDASRALPRWPPTRRRPLALRSVSPLLGIADRAGQCSLPHGRPRGRARPLRAGDRRGFERRTQRQ